MEIFKIQLGSLVVHWDAVPQEITISSGDDKTSRAQTKSRAICLVDVFLQTFVE